MEKLRKTITLNDTVKVLTKFKYKDNEKVKVKIKGETYELYVDWNEIEDGYFLTVLNKFEEDFEDITEEEMENFTGSLGWELDISIYGNSLF